MPRKEAYWRVIDRATQAERLKLLGQPSDVSCDDVAEHTQDYLRARDGWYSSPEWKRFTAAYTDGKCCSICGATVHLSTCHAEDKECDRLVFEYGFSGQTKLDIFHVECRDCHYKGHVELITEENHCYLCGEPSNSLVQASGRFYCPGCIWIHRMANS
jgi:hypothetical protein